MPYTGKTAWIPTVPRVLAFDRDSKDEPWINLAIAAQATFLVSRDSDGVRLRKIAPNLQILDPVQFLREVRKREIH
jgi:predicted nucleic acid-binding protein